MITCLGMQELQLISKSNNFVSTYFLKRKIIILMKIMNMLTYLFLIFTFIQKSFVFYSIVILHVSSSFVFHYFASILYFLVY